MKVQFNCAVRNVTGTRHIIEAGGRKILLDCGLFQGPRKLWREKNLRFHFKPADVSNCVLSHAHIDHSGALPALVASGYNKSIFATPATIDFCDIMWRDCAHILEMDAKYLNRKNKRRSDEPVKPLYTEEDVEKALRLLKPMPYEKTFEPIPGVRTTFFDAGHILGSAVTLYEIKEDGRDFRLGFTGDLGRRSVPILCDPYQLTGLDALISESTYGAREHSATPALREELATLVNQVHKRGGKLLIPAFSVGRTQNILYFLHQLLEERKIPPQPIFLDSPLSIKATDIVSNHSNLFDTEADEFYRDGANELFSFEGVQFTPTVKDSKKINEYGGPCIIISASGMCENGRILHHIKNNVTDKRSAVLLVGWQAPYTLGRRLLEGEKKVKIFNRLYKRKIEVNKINGFSAHADGPELAAYAHAAIKPQGRVFLIHGEYDASEALQQRLAALGNNNVYIPEDHEWVTL